MPAEHAPKVAAMGLISRREWFGLSLSEKAQAVANAKNEAMLKMVQAARSRRLIPVGEPQFVQAYVVKPGPPVEDLGPSSPLWQYVALVGTVNTMGVVE